MGKVRELVSFWLVPAEPANAFLAATISSLAARFEAAAFQPHVTIYVTRNILDDPSALLRRTVAGCAPFSLKVRSIDWSGEFTKTVFLQFKLESPLSRLSRRLQRASGFRNDYQLNPHLSLIYKTIDRETKSRVASSIQLPFAEVRFDSVKAVLSRAEIKSRRDVEAWRIVAEQKLSG